MVAVCQPVNTRRERRGSVAMTDVAFVFTSADYHGLSAATRLDPRARQATPAPAVPSRQIFARNRAPYSATSYTFVEASNHQGKAKTYHFPVNIS